MRCERSDRQTHRDPAANEDLHWGWECPWGLVEEPRPKEQAELAGRVTPVAAGWHTDKGGGVRKDHLQIRQSLYFRFRRTLKKIHHTPSLSKVILCLPFTSRAILPS